MGKLILLAATALGLAACGGTVSTSVSTACADVSKLATVLPVAEALGSAVPGLDAALVVGNSLVASTCADQAAVDQAVTTLQGLIPVK